MTVLAKRHAHSNSSIMSNQVLLLIESTSSLMKWTPYTMMLMGQRTCDQADPREEPNTNILLNGYIT